MSVGASEVLAQFCKAADNQKILSCRSRVQLLVLEDPGVAMGNEHGVQTCGECWIDVGLRAVSDHPCRIVSAVVLLSHVSVNTGVLFGHDFDGCKKLLHRGSLDLAALLGRSAFGDEDKTMTGRKVLESLQHLGKEFDG